MEFIVSLVHLCFCVFCYTEKYFDMQKKQCREALEIYRRFLARMERCAEFLKVAEVRMIKIVRSLYRKKSLM